MYNYKMNYIGNARKNKGQLRTSSSLTLYHLFVESIKTQNRIQLYLSASSETQIFPTTPPLEQLTVNPISLSSNLNPSNSRTLEPLIDLSSREKSLSVLNEDAFTSQALHEDLHLLPATLHEELVQASSSFDPISPTTSNYHLNSPTLSLMTSPPAANPSVPSTSTIGQPDLSISPPTNIKHSDYSSFEFPILPGQALPTAPSPVNPPSISNHLTTSSPPNSVPPTSFPATSSPLPLFYSRRKKSHVKLNSDILDDIGTATFGVNKNTRPEIASKTGFAFQPSSISPKNPSCLTTFYVSLTDTA